MYAVLLERPYACVFAVVGYDERMWYPFVTPIGTDLMSPKPYDSFMKAKFGRMCTYATYELAEKRRLQLISAAEKDAQVMVRELEDYFQIPRAATRTRDANPFTGRTER
jgi:hypothetical protein